MRSDRRGADPSSETIQHRRISQDWLQARASAVPGSAAGGRRIRPAREMLQFSSMALGGDIRAGIAPNGELNAAHHLLSGAGALVV